MNGEQVRRYGRQILLDAVGGRGQRALLAAAVRLELGRGADGQAAQVALLYLAGAGVGTLIVREAAEAGAEVGAGRVAAADLGMLFDERDVGEPRLEVVAKKIAALNPDVRVVAEGDGTALQWPDAPEGMSDAAAHALWRGSAAATRALATILSASRTMRP